MSVLSIPEQQFESPELGALSERTRDFSSLQMVMDAVKQAPKLTFAEEAQLADAAHSGNKDAFDRLVLSGLPQVVHIGKRFRHLGVEFEDLIQEGSIALLSAAGNYNPKTGFRFGSYSKYQVLNSVSRAVTRYAHIIHLPQRVELGVRQIEEVENSYLVAQGRQPEPAELLRELGDDVASDKEGVQFLRHLSRRKIISFDYIPADADSEEFSPLAEQLPGDENVFEQVLEEMDRTRLHQALAKLLAVHKKQFFAVAQTSGIAGPKLSYKQAGERMDPPVSQEAARKMAIRGMRFLSEELSTEGRPGAALCTLETN